MSDSTSHPALARVLRRPGGSESLDLLGRLLSGSDATTLLLAAMADRSDQLRPRDVARAYSRDRFVTPSELDPIVLARLRLLALESLSRRFTPIELAPLAPLGSHSVFSRVSQNNVISTTRMSEVAADPTNQLALEAAVQRQRLMATSPRSAESVRLCGVERVVRSQVFDGPRSFAHFTLLGAVVAGRVRAGRLFEEQALGDLLMALTTFLHRATNHHVIVHVTDFDGTFEGVVDQVMDRLDGERTSCVADPHRSAGRTYYQGLGFKLSVDDGDEVVEIGDGGLTDWTATLMNNAKERVVIGGISLDRLATIRLDSEAQAGTNTRADRN